MFSYSEKRHFCGHIEVSSYVDFVYLSHLKYIRLLDVMQLRLYLKYWLSPLHNKLLLQKM